MIIVTSLQTRPTSAHYRGRPSLRAYHARSTADRSRWTQPEACWVLCLILLWAISSSQGQPIRQEGLVLLTPEEAAQLRLTEEWPPSPRGRAPALGPGIVIKSPQLKEASAEPTIETVTPLEHLFIRFEETRAPVDMDLLQVEARKWGFTKSLTALLRPYLKGTTLEAKGVKIPEGRFLIHIAIADINGAKTEETYRFEVKR